MHIAGAFAAFECCLASTAYILQRYCVVGRLMKRATRSEAPAIRDHWYVDVVQSTVHQRKITCFCMPLILGFLSILAPKFNRKKKKSVRSWLIQRLKRWRVPTLISPHGDDRMLAGALRNKCSFRPSVLHMAYLYNFFPVGLVALI